MTLYDFLKDATVFAAVIGGIWTLIDKIITLLATQKRTQSETDYNFSQTIRQYIDAGGDIAEMSLKIATEYEKQVNTLNAKMDDLRELIALQSEYIKTLADVLRAAGLDVPARPDKLKDSNPRIKAIK